MHIDNVCRKVLHVMLQHIEAFSLFEQGVHNTLFTELTDLLRFLITFVVPFFFNQFVLQRWRHPLLHAAA